MIKKITFLVLFLAIVGTSLAQDTVFITRVYKDKKLIEKKAYGINGNILWKETKLNDEPEMWFMEFMIYDKNKLIRSSHYINNADVTDYFYTYNDKGNLEKKQEIQKGIVSGESLYEYNDKGWLVTENCNIGKIKRIAIVYEYTPEGLVKRRSETIADSNRTMELSEVYFYTDAGKMARMVGLNGTDTISDFRYIYDKYGFRLQQHVISHGDSTLTIEWLYGRNGAYPMIEKHIADGLVVRQTKNFFYKTGRIKKEVIIEYRVYSGKMKPEKTVKKYKYIWHE